MDGPRLEAFEAFCRLRREDEPAVFFDGTLRLERESRTPAEADLRQWSFAATVPTEGLCVRGGRAWQWSPTTGWCEADGDPWALLRTLVTRARAEGVPGVPWPHGVAGIATYDAGRLVEKLPSVAEDDTRLPQLLFFRFEAVLAISEAGAARVLSCPGGEEAAAKLRQRLDAPSPPFEERGAPGTIMPHTSQEAFEEMVRRGKWHVREGDVFQVNLSHRLETHTRLSPLHLYSLLREANPAPFSAFFQSGPLPHDMEAFHVLSSSPERLFRLQGGRVEARPIAGTRRRDGDAAKDAALVNELRHDPKEQAEHVMLVDLARNDLGRVARYGSVRVPELLTVETYRTVHHLVSVVEAELEAGRDAVDAMVALFPGGTITGAPKVRAMEVIETLEPVRRGVYTGSLGWFGPTGDCDFNILIRTLFHRGGLVHLQVGAGIVEDSEPEREYHETLAKAQGLLRALRSGEST